MKSNKKTVLHRNVVSVWLSNRRLSKLEYLEYLDNRPIPYRFDESVLANSKFESDFSLDYDDSHLDCLFSSKIVSVDKILDQVESVSPIRDGIVAAARKRRITKTNSGVILPDFGFDRTGADRQPNAVRVTDVVNRRAKLKFIGSFDLPPPEVIFATVDVPMRKTRMLLKKYDPLTGSFETFAVERTGNTLMQFFGPSLKKLKRRKKEYESPKGANIVMTDVVNERLGEGYEIVADGRSWKFSVTQYT